MRFLACNNFTIFCCCRIGVALHVVLALVSISQSAMLERSGSVVECLTRDRRAVEPHWHHCIVVLEQDTFILAWYWFSPERPVPV